MRTMTIRVLAPLLLAASAAGAQTQQSSYPRMAPVDQYLIPDRAAEIALARSAAPPSISGNAEILTLDRTGYVAAVKGTNGFVCLVERSWDSPAKDPNFWNPKGRGPNCLNPAAARTYLPIITMRTQLALAGKSEDELTRSVAAALDAKQLPGLEPGAMCYMLSKEQYLNDAAHAWHPHLMFLVSGDAADTWGANHDDGPMIAVNDPTDRLTIMMVTVSHWSDGSAATKM